MKTLIFCVAVTAQPQEKVVVAEPPAEVAADAKKESGEEEGAAVAPEAEGEKKGKEGGGWLSGWGMSNISNMVGLIFGSNCCAEASVQPVLIFFFFFFGGG